jgi:Protein of unknown function (DUF3043)
VRFLRRAAESADTEDATASVEPEPATARPNRTPAKGRPTPRRRDAQGKRRGPASPPPRTQREAARLAKQNRPSKEERRAEAADRRARMAAGDDSVLLPRDRGPVKAYIRDVVDSRRHLLGLFMPLAGLVFLSVLVPVRGLQTYLSLVCFALLAALVVEGVFLGRQINRKVAEKFPDAPTGLGLGWYASMRASQPRRLRMPKPRTAVGANP